MKADNVTAQPIPGTCTYRDSPAYLGPHPDDGLSDVPTLRVPEEAEARRQIFALVSQGVILDSFDIAMTLNYDVRFTDALCHAMVADGTIASRPIESEEEPDAVPDAPDKLVLCPVCGQIKRVGRECGRCVEEGNA